MNLGERGGNRANRISSVARVETTRDTFSQKGRVGLRPSQSAASRYTSLETSETGWRRAFDSPRRPLFTPSQ